MTNFEKCKEEIKLEDFINGYNVMCEAIHKVRGEEHCSSRSCTSCHEWLKQEYKPQILDKAEKKYLGNIVRPFRDKDIRVIKQKSVWDINKEKIFIEIYIGGYDVGVYCLNFPPFEKNTMYKGMKTDKEYTLEELGL